MFAKLLGLSAGVAFGLFATIASATPITTSYAFDAHGFGPEVTYPDISGTFTETFDPANTKYASPVDAFSSNLSGDYSPVQFLNDPFNVTGHIIYIGNDCSGIACQVAVNSNRLLMGFYIDDFGIPLSDSVFVYTSAGNYLLNSGTGTVASLMPAVPVPATFPLFGVALLALAGFGSVLNRHFTSKAHGTSARAAG